MSLEWIDVNKDQVKMFCDWWKNGKYSSDDKQLSQYFEPAGIDFDTIKTGEDLLRTVFGEVKDGKEGAIINAVLILDSIYRTQIRDVIGFAVKDRKESVTMV